MLPVSRVIGHKEWAPGRKSDPTYDMNWRRAGVAAITAQEAPELDATELNAVLSTHQAIFYGGGDAGPKSIIERLQTIEDEVFAPEFTPKGATAPIRRTLGVAGLNAYVGQFYGGTSTPQGKSLYQLVDEQRERAEALDAKLDRVLSLLADHTGGEA
jgi:hypothetical protein